MENQTYQQGEYTISTDPARLDIAVIHQFLSVQSYWAQGRPLETVQTAVKNSLNFGVYQGQRQVGYARVVTDYCTFAWLCDVFILPEARGAGLGKWLVACVTAHPQLKALRRLLLATRDAQELYHKYGGFAVLAKPDRWMEKINADV